MNMFSQSLASTFLITKIIPTPYDGNADQYVQFELLWQKADNQMNAMGFSWAARLWELKKVLKGSALNYVQALPPEEDSSYQLALQTLKMIFGTNQFRLRTIVKGLLTLPVMSSGSFHERQKFHSKILAYKQGVASLGLSAADTLFAFELIIIESRLDEDWKKQWIRFCNTKKDTKKPLGVDVSYSDLLNRLLRSMTEQQQMTQSGDMITHAKKQTQGNKFHSTAPKSFAAAPTVRKFPTKPLFRAKSKVAGSSQFGRSAPKRGGFTGSGPPSRFGPPGKFGASTAQKPAACPFCKNGSEQKFKHNFPLSCPLLRGPRKMRSDDVVKIVKQKRLCFNCFAPHATDKCDAPASIKCPVTACQKRHSVHFHYANKPGAPQ
jgi:hypothetical protein